MGGKTFSVSTLRDMIPYHNSYIEVFGGGATLLFAKTISFKEIYNDLDSLLYNFFMVLRDRPAEFYDKLLNTPLAREMFDKYKAHFRAGRLIFPQRLYESDDIDRAVYYYLVKRLSFGNKCQSLNFQKTSSSARMIAADCENFSNRLRNVLIENSNYDYIFDTYDEQDAFFYCDPPYHQTGGAYIECWPWDHHLKLRARIGNLKGRWLLSYNDHPDIRKLYDGFNIYQIKTRFTIDKSSKNGLEVYDLAITNYKA